MKRALKFLGGIASATLATSAMAQVAAPVAAAPEAANDAQVQDIVVTAQRRSENLQNVPIAITALTGSQLGGAGVVSTQDLASVTPALTMGSTVGYSQPRIRGIGSTANGAGIENPVAVYVDGVYYAAAPAGVFSLSDVDRLEVLKGPQGTLFGRNATGGLIQVVTRNPTDHPEMNVALSYGNYGTITADTFVAGPLTDDVRASVSMHYGHQQNGYGINVATGNDVNKLDHDFAGRAKLVARLGEAKFTLSGDYNDTSGSSPAIRPDPRYRPALGQPRSNKVWDNDSDVDPIVNNQGGGGSLKAEVPIGFANLVSITAYRKSKFYSLFDYDGTPIPFQTISLSQRDSQFSQEIQLQSRSGSHISWTVGAYYFDADSRFNPVTVNLFGPAALGAGVNSIFVFGEQKTKSYAGFGQVTLPLGERTNLTGGLRYTSEKRSLNGSVFGAVPGVGTVPLGQTTQDQATFNKLTWRASIDHRFNSELLVYASYNRGFKSGGFNPQTFGVPAYRPEVLDAIEGGVKADLLDRKLRINASGFYYDYSNIQVGVYSPSGTSYLINGAKAEVYGIDADVTLVVSRNFKLDGGLSIIHDRFKSFPNAVLNIPIASGGFNQIVGSAAGNRLPVTPDWTANIGGTYTIRVGNDRIDLSANYFHSDGYFGQPDNIVRQNAYDTLNASVTWQMKSGLSLSAWGRNLTDTVVATALSPGVLSSGTVYAPPRTYGGTLAFSF